MLLCTKYHHCRYEEEHRIFVNLKDAREDKGMYFCYFDRSFELTEVILGPNCKESLDDLRKRVQARYPRATTIKSRPAIKHYAVVPDPPSRYTSRCRPDFRGRSLCIRSQSHRRQLRRLDTRAERRNQSVGLSSVQPKAK